MRHEDIIQTAALAGRVRRYHTWPTLREQSVAEHSHRVAMLYVQMYGLPPAEILLFCLQHDLGELFGGDIPHYAKRAVPALKEASDLAEIEGLHRLGLEQPSLTADQFRRVKTCDLLEMHEFSQIEANMGNRYALVVIDNVQMALQKLLPEEGEYRETMLRFFKVSAQGEVR